MRGQGCLVFFLAALLGGALASACGQSAQGPAGPGGNTAAAGSAVGGIPSVGGAVAGGALPGRGGAGGTLAGQGGEASGGTMAIGFGGARGTSSGGSTAPLGGSGGLAAGGAAGGSDAAVAEAGPDTVKSDDTALRDGAADQRATGGAGGNAVDAAAGAGGNRDAGIDPNQKITVWLAGDSTVMNCSSSCPCGWGSQFQPLLGSNATVVNSAVGGRSIQTWLFDPNVTTTMGANGECVVDPKTYSTRWQAMIDPASGMKPGDYLFIEFGINDGDTTCNRHVGSALFQSYLDTMAQAAKKLGAQPVFLTSTSYIACSGSTATTNRGFVTETKAAGKANDVPVIDLTALSAALYTSLGLCPNNADYTSTTSAVGKFFCDDHTHFESAGAAQIAKLVAKAIKDQGIGLAAYLRAS